MTLAWICAGVACSRLHAGPRPPCLVCHLAVRDGEAGRGRCKGPSLTTSLAARAGTVFGPDLEGLGCTRGRRLQASAGAQVLVGRHAEGRTQARPATGRQPQDAFVFAPHAPGGKLHRRPPCCRWRPAPPRPAPHIDTSCLLRDVLWAVLFSTPFLLFSLRVLIGASQPML